MILDLFCKEIEFDNIHGYEDIKDVVRRALDAEDNYNYFYGYLNGTEFLHFDQAYAAALSGIQLGRPHFGDTSRLFEHMFYNRTRHHSPCGRRRHPRVCRHRHRRRRRIHRARCIRPAIPDDCRLRRLPGRQRRGPRSRARRAPKVVRRDTHR
jgi:hypothetical protein